MNNPCNYNYRFFKLVSCCIALAASFFSIASASNSSSHFTSNTDPEYLFKYPPPSASPGVLWMWMGSNISKKGITKDLEALKNAGFNRTTMFSLSDVTTPWAGEIQNSPTPQIIAWTEPWWDMVRFAAKESKRLGMDFGMFHCPGYEASGGSWISPEMSMQEICWSTFRTSSKNSNHFILKRPEVDPHANMPWPVYNPLTTRVEKPVIEARKNFYKDIAVLAVPASGVIKKSDIINLSKNLQPNGYLRWEVPPGDWIIYRIGHTTMGSVIQPAQWAATGLECDKMNPEAVSFHLDHVIGELKKQLGKLVGNGFSHLHFDSYEAGTPSWTPRMREEFWKRRGYDPLPYLLVLTGRNVGGSADSIRFRNDFEETIKDLYRDVYFKTIQTKLKKAGLTFLCEPYGGPWRFDDVMPLVDRVMTEFWTKKGTFAPYELESTVAALRKSGQNIVEAEAFTGLPNDSKWNETPAWLKPIGDAAFCAGVNRLVLHRFVHQPWEDNYKPGMAMGQWGTHFDRTQTWWNEINALVKYWKRCQALLQWGKLDTNHLLTSKITRGNITLKSICRSKQQTLIYFIANTSHLDGTAICSFRVTDMQPELWNPVTGETKLLSEFSIKNNAISIALHFADAQSFFVVFRKKITKCNSYKTTSLPIKVSLLTITTPWEVQFDSTWGGPTQPVVFEKTEDWTQRSEPGVKYYSGTAEYNTTFDLRNSTDAEKYDLVLSLGSVKCVAHVYLNNYDLGTIWTAPWEVSIPDGILNPTQNKLKIRITNVWANRLIGDHLFNDDCEWLPGHEGGRFLKKFPEWFVNKEPRPSRKRFCFTTWDYFSDNSALESSGLLGPVEIYTTKFK